MKRNASRDESKIDNIGRGKPSAERPWLWVEKKALAMITDTFSESKPKQAGNARSVYVSLCQIASDERSDTFTVNKALIAYKAGVSVKTVERLLPDLEALGLVTIRPNKAAGMFKTANTYTLLPMRRGDASLRQFGDSQLSDKVDKTDKTKLNTKK